MLGILHAELNVKRGNECFICVQLTVRKGKKLYGVYVIVKDNMVLHGKK